MVVVVNSTEHLCKQCQWHCVMIIGASVCVCVCDNRFQTFSREKIAEQQMPEHGARPSRV